jgi:hypothetical protein
MCEEANKVSFRELHHVEKFLERLKTSKEIWPRLEPEITEYKAGLPVIRSR